MLLLPMIASLGGAVAPSQADEPPWAEVLAPDGPWPAPADAVEWRTDLGAALDEARTTGRPLFVTLRCLPCKQCAGFDAAVLEGSADLDDLLARFVTVRLTDADAIDLRAMPVAGWQDLDLSWWGWLLSSDARVYAVFGGRDADSDESRISVSALERVLERVLDHHADPRRSGWGVDAPAPRLDGPPRTPADLPGRAAWEERVADVERSASCLHCHQVAEIIRQPALDAGTFDKARDLAMWPLPENVGLVLERDHGLRVSAVTAGGAAERAGVRAGDELGAADGQRLFGQADLRGVLHRLPRDARALELVVLREGAVRTFELGLEPGWRATDLSWRMSVTQGNVGAPPGFWPLAGPESGRGSLSLRPYWGPRKAGPAWDAGLRPHHVVRAVDGERPDLAGRGFLAWFRLRYEPGDEVALEVTDGDATRTIRYVLGR